MPTTANLHVLDNGLQVTWEEDRRQPLVAIEARIKGGLRAEGPYVGTGLTHFIEHMLFKGTPTRPPGTIEQEVRRYGGTINAFTSFDVTGVTLFVEARHLKDALALLADILQHAQFPPEEFEKERQVIISEIQMNLDDPERRLQQLFWQTHFLEHPYRHPILGYQSLLEQLQVQDMADFYAAQYQPQNVTLSCVGDVQSAALVQAVAEIFGAWPRGRLDPAQQLVPAEPPTASAKLRTVTLPVQASYVAMGFASTRLTDPATHAGDVLAHILGQGQSSRLYERIVRQRQLAADIAAWNYTPYDPGVFGIQLRTTPEKVEAARRAVVEILEEIGRDGVTEAELRKAQRSLATSYVFHLQTFEAKAADLASALTGTGDPAFSRQYLKNIERVTQAQVQAAAQQLLDPSRMTTVIIQPATAPTEAPAPATAPPLAVTKAVLPNGLTVLVGADPRLPMVSLVVGARGGVRVEEEAHEGLSNLTAQLLTKGTSKRTAVQIAEQVESLGGVLRPFSGRDGFGFSLQLLSEDLPAGLSLAQEIVTEATFPAAELEIQRGLIRQQLQAQEDEVFVVGSRLLRRTLFGRHPYRFDPLGRAESLAAIRREDCLALAKRQLNPANMVVAVFGDVQADQVLAQLQRHFGTLPAQDLNGTWPKALQAEPLTDIRTAQQTVDKEQAVVMLGFRGLTHASPERPALEVATAILSGMAGRLFQAVREQHGLSYTLGAANVPGWDPGYVLIYAATRPKEQARVLALVEEQLETLRKEGFTAEEVAQAQRYLIGAHRMEIQDLTDLAKRATLDELYGLGYDAWTRYVERIQAVTVAQANAAVNTYFTLPQRAQIVVSPDS